MISLWCWATKGREKTLLLLDVKWEFNFTPLYTVVIYYPWQSDSGPQEVKCKCNRKRKRWTVWSPACKSSFFMRLGHPGRWSALVVNENSRAVHVITMTPVGVGWDLSSVPWLPGALLAWSSTSSLPSLCFYSLSLSHSWNSSIGWSQHF